MPLEIYHSNGDFYWLVRMTRIPLTFFDSENLSVRFIKIERYYVKKSMYLNDTEKIKTYEKNEKDTQKKKRNEKKK